MLVEIVNRTRQIEFWLPKKVGVFHISYIRTPVHIDTITTNATLRTKEYPQTNDSLRILGGNLNILKSKLASIMAFERLMSLIRNADDWFCPSFSRLPFTGLVCACANLSDTPNPTTAQAQK